MRSGVDDELKLRKLTLSPCAKTLNPSQLPHCTIARPSTPCDNTLKVMFVQDDVVGLKSSEQAKPRYVASAQESYPV
jgi:hypothetical protein